MHSYTGICILLLLQHIVPKGGSDFLQIKEKYVHSFVPRGIGLILPEVLSCEIHLHVGCPSGGPQMMSGLTLILLPGFPPLLGVS